MHLTKKQRRVLQLSRRGLSRAEIAQRMGIRPENVSRLKARAMKKVRAFIAAFPDKFDEDTILVAFGGA
jgi:RNA polymerase sigma factor (sigma-70 family)